MYELGGYLDNVLAESAELDESGFCIATYLKFHIKDVIENVIDVIDRNNNNRVDAALGNLAANKSGLDSKLE